MNLEENVKSILDGKAILFAGAGFSHGAENIDHNVPNSKKLVKRLFFNLDEKIDKSIGLEQISQYYVNNNKTLELIEILKKEYNIIRVAEHHKIIMSCPWRRIYTTNYDQSIEIASREVGKIRDPRTLDDDMKDDYDKSKVCIHINGYIEKLTEKTLNSSFKLTDRSYSCNELSGNEWFELLKNDIFSAKLIIIIGYSMKFDIDIKRLFSSKEISSKTLFIDSPDINKFDRNLLESYGSVYDIGIDGFAKLIEKNKKEYISNNDFVFESFYEYKSYNENIKKATYSELYDFYTQGKVCNSLYYCDGSGTYPYLLYRHEMDRITLHINSKQVWIILSRLGNGKTVFISILIRELLKDNYRVFKFDKNGEDIEFEIEKIGKCKDRCVVIFDNYPGHLDVIEKFSFYNNKNVKFILSARNSVHKSSYKSLVKKLKIVENKYDSTILDQLNNREVNDLSYILTDEKIANNNLVTPLNKNSLKNFIINECKSEISQVLLKMYHAQHIKDRFEELYKRKFQNLDIKLRRVIIFLLIKDVCNFDLNFAEVLDIFEADAVSLYRDNEFVNEVVTNNNDFSIVTRSSIISSAIIRDVVEFSFVIDTMKIAFKNVDNKSATKYKELQKTMLSHSHLKYLYKDSLDNEHIRRIEDYYDSLRHTTFANNNALFWGQFALAYIDIGKYDVALQCINVAYQVSKNTGFIPYQIKTIEGKCIIEKCIYALSNDVCAEHDAIDTIIKSSDILMEYYTHNEMNQHYVFRVVGRYPDIFDKIEGVATVQSINKYIEITNKMIKLMSEYEKTEHFYGVDFKSWKNRLTDSCERAKELLRSK